LEQDPQDGFVIITADSDQGMVDIHDRRPVVLSSKHA
jgi:putative SOS response-associated peptidase YedK